MSSMTEALSRGLAFLKIFRGHLNIQPRLSPLSMHTLPLLSLFSKLQVSQARMTSCLKRLLNLCSDSHTFII